MLNFSFQKLENYQLSKELVMDKEAFENMMKKGKKPVVKMSNYIASIKKISSFLIFFMIGFLCYSQEKYDVVIVGGNPGGITAAISAAKAGKKVLILERTSHIGGLPANGLGATDIATKGATTGLFHEFVERNRKYYLNRYGDTSRQYKVCQRGYHFEPSVAEKNFQDMLAEHPSIKVLTLRQFDVSSENIRLSGNRIESITITNRGSGKKEIYEGTLFIDATYEGDLAAAAGVPYRIGREAKSEFQEPGAGITYKYWGGPEAEGTTGLSDNAVQAYNYRLCLTDKEDNKTPVAKPASYNRNEYLSLADDYWSGNYTGYKATKISQEQQEENRNRRSKKQQAIVPGMPEGLRWVVNPVNLPNAKTDANNQHYAFISTDLPEENWPWPSSSWEWRDLFAKRLRDYTLGLIWFCQHDTALPPEFRQEMLRWGFAADEYTDNNNFPRQVYVREGRRIEGIYFFTAKDALPVTENSRPPIHATSITASHYALDSHATRKREAGKAHLEGFISYHTKPYTVPFGVIVPKNCDNLLCPVPVSGSHIGFSTLRMEPCWMALGQAAGIAASLAIDNNTSPENIPVDKLQKNLLSQGVTLIFFEDIRPGDEHAVEFQLLGLQGYIPQWKVNASGLVTREDLMLWEELSGKTLDCQLGTTTRGEMLMKIYSLIEQSR